MTPWNLLIYAFDPDGQMSARVQAAVDDMHGVLGTSAPYPITIVVQRDGKDGNTRHTLSAGKVSKEHIGKAINEQTSLKDFLKNCNAPGSQNALIMWAHGTGIDVLEAEDNLHLRLYTPPRGYFRRPPFAGFGPSFYKLGFNGVYILDTSIRQAIKESGIKLNLVGFNACEMGTLEVLNELADLAPLQLATATFSNDWPYGKIIAGLSQATATVSPKALGAAIVGSVQAAIDADPKRNDALFLFDSQQLKTIVDKVGPYGNTIVALKKKPPWPSLITQVGDDNGRAGGTPEYIDLLALLANLNQPDLTQMANEIRPLLTPLATATSKATADRNGVAIFCPEYQYDIDAAYKGFKFDGNAWKAALKAIRPDLPLM